MTEQVQTATTTITELNDRFRKGDRSLGRWMLTATVNALPRKDQIALCQAVRHFDQFTAFP